MLMTDDVDDDDDDDGGEDADDDDDDGCDVGGDDADDDDVVAYVYRDGDEQVLLRSRSFHVVNNNVQCRA